MWRKVGQVVESPTTGSNPGGAEIGLHVFHKQYYEHEYWKAPHFRRVPLSTDPQIKAIYMLYFLFFLLVFGCKPYNRYFY